jgi:hypothetical protein
MSSVPDAASSNLDAAEGAPWAVFCWPQPDESQRNFMLAKAWLRAASFMRFSVGALALALLGCGGNGEPEPDVTMVFRMTLYDESTYFLDLMDAMAARGIKPSRIQCGLDDGINNPPGLVPNYFDGYAPRLAYLTVKSSEADKFAKVPGWTHGIYDATKWSPSSPPFDCGPLPTR